MKKGDDIVFVCQDGRRVGRLVGVGDTGILTAVSDGETYTFYEDSVRRVLSAEDRTRAHEALEVLRKHPEEPVHYGEAISTLLGLVRGEVPHLFLSTAAWSELPYLLTSERALRGALEAGHQLLQLVRLLDSPGPQPVKIQAAEVAPAEPGPVMVVPATEVPAQPGPIMLRDYVPPTHDALPPGTKARMVDLLVESHRHEEVRRPCPRPKLVVKKRLTGRCQECSAPVSPEFAVCSGCYEKRQGRKPMKPVADGWIGTRRA